MRYDKKSIDYQINLEALHEMEDCVPMTRPERNALRNWVKAGHDIDTNPWKFADSDGWQLSFLQAYRLYYGCSCGPWDYWRSSKEEPLWDDATKRFLSKEDY